MLRVSTLIGNENLYCILSWLLFHALIYDLYFLIFTQVLRKLYLEFETFLNGAFYFLDNWEHIIILTWGIHIWDNWRINFW